MTGCLIPEFVGIEKNVSFIYEEEEVLVRIKPLGYEDIADERE